MEVIHAPQREPAEDPRVVVLNARTRHLGPKIDAASVMLADPAGQNHRVVGRHERRALVGVGRGHGGEANQEREDGGRGAEALVPGRRRGGRDTLEAETGQGKG